MGGLPGLGKVFCEEFPKANPPTVQVHVARYVLAKVLHKMEKEVADEIGTIFYASSKEKSL